MKPFLIELRYQLRWGLPIWFLWLLTTWWPNNRITIKLRGLLHRPFFKECGPNLTMASGVRLLNTHEIVIGRDVYLSYYVWLNGLGRLTIEDEVILGPYVTISTLKHCFHKGSVRFGGATPAQVKIGKGSFLGAHVSVAAGVSIGPGCLLAANSLALEDMPAHSFALGVPAKVIREAKDKEACMMSRSGWQRSA